MADIVVSSEKKKRKWQWIMAVAALVLALGAGMFLRWLTAPHNTTQRPQTASGLPKPIDDVQNLRLNGDEVAANARIEQGVNDPDSSPATKYMLYIQQGHVHDDVGEWQQAIDSYKKAAAIKADYQATHLIADAYKDMGDAAQAIAYYKKALVLVPNDPVRNATKANLEQKIRDLGGQP